MTVEQRASLLRERFRAKHPSVNQKRAVKERFKWWEFYGKGTVAHGSLTAPLLAGSKPKKWVGEADEVKHHDELKPRRNGGKSPLTTMACKLPRRLLLRSDLSRNGDLDRSLG